MVEDRLLSILQVSDLHFGNLLANGDADLPPGLGQVPWMSGQLGHHRLAAKDLHRFLAERRDRGEAQIPEFRHKGNADRPSSQPESGDTSARTPHRIGA